MRSLSSLGPLSLSAHCERETSFYNTTFHDVSRKFGICCKPPCSNWDIVKSDRHQIVRLQIILLARYCPRLREEQEIDWKGGYLTRYIYIIVYFCVCVCACACACARARVRVRVRVCVSVCNRQFLLTPVRTQRCFLQRHFPDTRKSPGLGRIWGHSSRRNGRWSYLHSGRSGNSRWISDRNHRLSCRTGCCCHLATRIHAVSKLAVRCWWSFQ